MKAMFEKTILQTYLSIEDNPEGLLLRSEHEFNLISSERLERCLQYSIKNHFQEKL
jgi:hypothetical protein